MFFYSHYEYHFSYWKKRKIQTNFPVPYFGNLLEAIFYGSSVIDIKHREKFGDIWGSYNGMKPELFVCDKELAKQVLIRDFGTFVNRTEGLGTHEIWSKNAFVAKDEAWKRIRSILSPSFSSGKLRGMTGLMLESVHKLENHFDTLVKNGKPFDIKKVMAGFTIDVIASTSFAMDTDTNGKRDKENPFLYHGLNLFKVKLTRFIGIRILPESLQDFFDLKSGFSPEHLDFFINTMKQILDERKRTGMRRNDLTQLLIDAKQTDNLKKVNYNDLTATGEEDSGK